MARMTALTTTDNPFNPLTHFDQWYEFDKEKGYHSCEYLARLAVVSDHLGIADYLDTVEDTIDDIVKFNLVGILTDNKVNYKKVVA